MAHDMPHNQYNTKLDKGAFLVVGTGRMAGAALIEPIKPFECPLRVLSDGKMSLRPVIFKLA
jgi:hypothetical protein